MKETFVKISQEGKLSLVELEPNWRCFSDELHCNGIEMPGAYGVNDRLPVKFILVVDEVGRFVSSNMPNPMAGYLYGDVVNGIVGDCIVGKLGTRDGESDIVGLTRRDIEILKYVLKRLFRPWIERCEI